MSLITCPCCQARFPVEAGIEDAAARQAMTAALKMPAPLGDLVVSYLGLFRPAQNVLSWKRVAKLLNELLLPIRAAEITRNRSTWAAPQETWVQAFEAVLNQREKLSLPLTSHGYLFEIVARIANQAAGKEETRIESDRQHGSRSRTKSEPRSMADIVEEKKRAEWDEDLRKRAGLTVPGNDR